MCSFDVNLHVKQKRTASERVHTIQFFPAGHPSGTCNIPDEDVDVVVVVNFVGAFVDAAASAAVAVAAADINNWICCISLTDSKMAMLNTAFARAADKTPSLHILHLRELCGAVPAAYNHEQCSHCIDGPRAFLTGVYGGGDVDVDVDVDVEVVGRVGDSNRWTTEFMRPRLDDDVDVDVSCFIGFTWVELDSAYALAASITMFNW